MSDDSRAKARSDEGIRRLARRLRAFYAEFITDGRVDVLACLRSGRIWTVRGQEELIFVERDAPTMRGADAQTNSLGGRVAIELAASTLTDAQFGIGRARNTVAHELGHGVMHDGSMMRRGTGATGSQTPSYIRAFESAEHQVKVFAAAFLIDESQAATMSGPEEISAHFGVSLDSARIEWERLTETARRIESLPRIEKMVDAFRATAAPIANAVAYLAEPCPSCGNATLVPVGNKYLCATCQDVSDRFQDGDAVA